MNKLFRPLSRAEQNLRALLVGCALATLCGGAIATAYANQDPPTDERSCLVGRPPPVVKEVVIDATTRLTPGQATKVMTAVRAERDSLPRFGQIVLLTVDADHPYEPKAHLDLCNPGSPSQLSALFHTPSHAHRRWRSAFEKPLEDMAEALTKSGESTTSPLLETITGVTWRPEFRASRGKFAPPEREIVFVSDLRQFTPSNGFNFYQVSAPWPAFTRSPAGTALEADLHGVTVRLEVLHRPNPGLPESSVIGFWREWLSSRGAAHVIVDGVEAPPHGSASGSERGKER